MRNDTNKTPAAAPTYAIERATIGSQEGWYEVFGPVSSKLKAQRELKAVRASCGSTFAYRLVRIVKGAEFERTVIQ
jgi:hypothetical protein